jgi:methylated-DNA-protein-cysteine methyltransferase-like protein
MRRIWETIAEIPPGSVANYGQVAEVAGIPRGARQVGYALRRAPPGMELPWHRVVQASGRSAFDPNSRAFQRQRDRLAEEGVAMQGGRIDMNRYRWKPDLDELLWKPSSAWDEL